jgi:hypothetical protein
MMTTIKPGSSADGVAPDPWFDETPTASSSGTSGATPQKLLPAAKDSVAIGGSIKTTASASNVSQFEKKLAHLDEQLKQVTEGGSRTGTPEEGKLLSERSQLKQKLEAERSLAATAKTSGVTSNEGFATQQRANRIQTLHDKYMSNGQRDKADHLLKSQEKFTQKHQAFLDSPRQQELSTQVNETTRTLKSASAAGNTEAVKAATEKLEVLNNDPQLTDAAKASIASSTSSAGSNVTTTKIDGIQYTVIQDKATSGTTPVETPSSKFKAPTSLENAERIGMKEISLDAEERAKTLRLSDPKKANQLKLSADLNASHAGMVDDLGELPDFLKQAVNAEDTLMAKTPWLNKLTRTLQSWGDDAAKTAGDIAEGAGGAGAATGFQKLLGGLGSKLPVISNVINAVSIGGSILNGDWKNAAGQATSLALVAGVTTGGVFAAAAGAAPLLVGVVGLSALGIGGDMLGKAVGGLFGLKNKDEREKAQKEKLMQDMAALGITPQMVMQRNQSVG